MPLAFTFLVTPFLVAILTAMAIFSVVHDGDVVWLTNRFALWTGRRSYGLYLWHYPVVIAIQTANPDASFALRAVAMVPLSFVLAGLSWRYIETPFLRRKERYSTTSTARVHEGSPREITTGGTPNCRHAS
jgi:peptidoglycan/LPS O-acetylase OafA/YrhL